MNTKILAAAFLISAIILLLILLLSPEYKLNPKKISLENKSCSEMVDIYTACKGQGNEHICFEWYADTIINCYGKEILQDQLALINQSG